LTDLTKKRDGLRVQVGEKAGSRPGDLLGRRRSEKKSERERKRKIDLRLRSGEDLTEETKKKEIQRLLPQLDPYDSTPSVKKVVKKRGRIMNSDNH